MIETFKKYLERYRLFVFGKDLTFDIQKKVFLLITHISILIGIVGVVVDILLNLGLFLTLITFLTVLLVLFFHIKVRNSNLSLKYSLSFFLISIIILPILWIYNGGYNGNNIILIFVYFTVILTVLPANIRFTAFVVFFIMISSLTILHFNYPQIVSAYANENHRFVDLIIGYFMYLILAYNIQNIILKNYELDRKKIQDQNKELSTLVNRLNETNKKLEESINRVEELNSAKDRFVTILSHDLRSPFQGLIGITKTLENDYKIYTDEERKFYIFQINQSLDKLYSFLDQLLAWGKLQRNGVKINLENCFVNDLFENTLSVLNELVEQKKIIIQNEIDKSLKIFVDKEMFLTVFRNLLLNAIKFSSLGSTIKLSSNKTDSEVSISITDFGIGINQETLDKLFKIDHIVSTVGTGGELGSGMGLILCNDIVKKHNGKIIVESTEGKGATFTIALPILS